MIASLDALRPVLDVTPDALIVVDADSRIVEANDMAARIFGYDREELVGAPLEQLVPASARSVHAKHVARFHERPRHRRMGQGETLYARRNDGQPFPAEISLRPIDVGGRRYIVSAIRDVTEERERIRTIERQRRLLDQTQRLAGGWEVDVQTGHVAWTNTVYRIHGVAPGTPVTLDEAFAFYGPEARPVIRAAFERCVTHGTAYDVALPIETASGQQRWVRSVGSAIRQDGEVVKVAGAVQDITDQKNAEHRLTDSEAQYRTLFEAAPLAVLVIDPDTGRLLDANDAACSLFGCPEGLVGRPYQTVHPDDVADSAWADLVAAARARGVVHREAVPIHRAGEADGLADISGRLTERDGGSVLVAFFRDVTDAVHRERALRRQRARHQEAQRIAHLGHWTYHIDRDHLEWSDEVYRIFGRSPDTFEPTDAAFQEQVMPADRPKVRAALERALNEGVRYTVEHRIVRPDGEVRVVEENAELMETASGLQLMGTVLDVTERKRVEEQLAASQHELEAVLSSITDGVFTLDRSFRFQYLNPQAARLVNSTVDALQGNVIWDVYPEATETAYYDLYREAMESATPTTFVEYYPPFDQWFEGSIYPSDEGITIFFRDITERKHLEDELERERQFLQKLFDSIPVMLTVYDPAFEHFRVNAEFERVFGWSTDEAATMDLMAAILPDPADRAAAGAFMQQPGDGWKEFTMQTRDGEEVYCSWTNIRLTDDSSVGIGIDNTERRHLEAQLRHSQKMETVGTLAGGIAHDFNNILHAVQAYVQLARERLAATSTEHDYLGRAQNGLGRASKLVQQLLAFSRQQGPDRREVFAVGAQVEEALDLIAPMMPADVELRTQTDATAQVEGDPDQVQQVAMNLLTNAVHALKHADGPERCVLDVDVRRISVDDDLASRYVDLTPGPYVRMTVSDTGAGMDEDTMERIFDPFYTTKETGDGTGLGLAVVHGIVRSHGGAVSVYSQPGEGATFQVYLPALEEPDAHPAAPRARAQPVAAHVLLVDDNKDIIEVETERLQQMGFAVTAYTDPLKARDHVARAPDSFDAVLTDYAMPEMTGPELVAALHGVRPDLPAVLFSGFSAQVDEEALRESGVDTLLRKPVPSDELRDALSQLLEAS